MPAAPASPPQCRRTPGTRGPCTQSLKCPLPSRTQALVTPSSIRRSSEGLTTLTGHVQASASGRGVSGVGGFPLTPPLLWRSSIGRWEVMTAGDRVRHGLLPTPGHSCRQRGAPGPPTAQRTQGPCQGGGERLPDNDLGSGAGCGPEGVLFSETGALRGDVGEN